MVIFNLLANFLPSYNLILRIPTHINEHRAVAGDPDHQVAVILRVELSIAQFIGVREGDLNLQTAHIKKRTDESDHTRQPLIRRQGLLLKTQIQNRCANRSAKRQLADRLQ